MCVKTKNHETLQMLNVRRPAAHFSLSLLTERYPLTLKPNKSRRAGDRGA